MFVLSDVCVEEGEMETERGRQTYEEMGKWMKEKESRCCQALGSPTVFFQVPATLQDKNSGKKEIKCRYGSRICREEMPVVCSGGVSMASSQGVSSSSWRRLGASWENGCARTTCGGGGDGKISPSNFLLHGSLTRL